MKFILIFLLYFTFFTSCSTDDDETQVEFIANATVLGPGLDCGDAFLIRLEDSNEIPENAFENVFYEINLPDEYKTEGNEIRVNFRLPTNEEIPFCTHMGPGYPHIFITDAAE